MAEKNTLKDLLAKYSTMIEFKAGKNIYNYSQKADKIYFILDGLIRIFIKDKDQELEIQRKDNGSFVGESAFTADFRSSRALTHVKTKALEFKVSDLKQLMKKNSSFAIKMINNLSHYIERLEKIRNSRLRIERIREDLRPIYKNFNLYNYSVISCSNCLFTARRKDFNSFSKKRKETIKAGFKTNIKTLIGNDFKINYTEPRRINQVLEAHYLALKLYDYTDFDADKKAFLWRELSWIYEDLGEKNLAEKASINALKNLEEFYFTENNGSSKSETDNLSLLLSVLYYKHDQGDKAITILDELIRDNKVSIRHRNKAKEVFLKIREENKNKK